MASQVTPENIKGPVILIVFEYTEEFKSRSAFEGLIIFPRVEDDGGFFRGRALEVIEDVMDPDIGEDLADAGNKHNTEFRFFHFFGNSRYQNGFRFQGALE